MTPGHGAATVCHRVIVRLRDGPSTGRRLRAGTAKTRKALAKTNHRSRLTHPRPRAYVAAPSGASAWEGALGRVPRNRPGGGAPASAGAQLGRLRPEEHGGRTPLRGPRAPSRCLSLPSETGFAPEPADRRTPRGWRLRPKLPRGFPRAAPVRRGDLSASEVPGHAPGSIPPMDTPRPRVLGLGPVQVRHLVSGSVEPDKSVLRILDGPPQ
jgi:hypothetical protein